VTPTETTRSRELVQQAVRVANGQVLIPAGIDWIAGTTQESTFVTSVTR